MVNFNPRNYQKRSIFLYTFELNVRSLRVVDQSKKNSLDTAMQMWATFIIGFKLIAFDLFRNFFRNLKKKLFLYI